LGTITDCRQALCGDGGYADCPHCDFGPDCTR
jgi:hypothetical protein